MQSVIGPNKGSATMAIHGHLVVDFTETLGIRLSGMLERAGGRCPLALD